MSDGCCTMCRNSLRSPSQPTWSAPSNVHVRPVAEFTFGCVTGAIHSFGEGSGVEFTSGSDEMDAAAGDGWAELREGEICFHNGDEDAFIARPWDTSSTACRASS
jgi:hypothetical protein